MNTRLLIDVPESWKTELIRISEGRPLSELVREAIFEKYFNRPEHIKIGKNELSTIAKKTCLRCNNTWSPRKENPTQCPYCKSIRWNTPKPTAEDRKNKKILKELKADIGKGNFSEEKFLIFEYILGMYPDAEMGYMVNYGASKSYHLFIGVPSQKLDIECDWDCTGTGIDREYNNEQDEYLNRNGWTVIRVAKDEVKDFVGGKLL